MQYQWTEAMATGDAQLDAEHRTLISWINRLSEANSAGKGEAEVRRILNFLGAYAARHFAHEESCFARHTCRHAGANRKAHEQFVETLGRITEECDAHGVTASRALELQRILGEWLQNHILRVDVALKPCIEGDR
jgi:hemerythrin-like metal-binding protein